jgi:hypothetical protein
MESVPKQVKRAIRDGPHIADGRDSRRVFLAAAAALMHMVVLSPMASAQCVLFENPPDLFARADVVFMGTVVRREATGAGGPIRSRTLPPFASNSHGKGVQAAKSGWVRTSQSNTGGSTWCSPAETLSQLLSSAGGRSPSNAATGKLEWLAKRGPAAAGDQSEDPLEDLTNAEGLWRSKKPKSYEFTIEVRCFCVGLSDTPPSFCVTESGSIAVSELDRSTFGAYDRYDTIRSFLRPFAAS